MAEKIFSAQRNYGWGLTLNMTGKAPAVSKRIFDTYADALAYANDVKDSAIEGLVLSVVADTNAALNGVYFVQQAASEAVKANDAEGIKAADAKEAILVKLGSEANANGGIAGVEGKLTQEIADRQAADKAITDSIGTVAEGKTVMGTVTEEVGKLNTAISNEQTTRENAFNTLKGTLEDRDAKTLEAINDELDAIDAKIGTVTENKTVVQMIADAETAAKAAATKMKLADNEELLTLSHTTDKAGAITYALGTNNVASDAELQAEVTRATGAEASLQAQIGKAATGESSATGLHKEIADVKAAYEAAIEAMDATKTGNGDFVDVTVKQVDGVITEVTVAESDIASASALTSEINRAKAAEEKALTDAKAYTDQEVNKLASGAVAKNETDIATEVSNRQSEITRVEGLITTETTNRTNAITALNADVTSAEGTKVRVQVVETAGKITDVNITDVDIASAAVLAEVKKDVDNFFKDADFTANAKDTLKELQEYINTDAAGASKMEKAIADNKAAIESEVTRAEAAEAQVLVDAKAYTNQEVKKLADGDVAKNATDIATEVSNRQGEITRVEGLISDETTNRTNAINALNADVTSAEGTKVRVQVVETAGKITAVTVTDVDIASATGLTAETKAREDADNALDGRLDIIEGSGKGSIKKALADAKAYTDTKITEEVTARTNAIASAKTDLIGSATTEYNTLGKLEGKIKDAEAAAKAAATKIAAKTEGHVTVSGVQDQTTSAWTYTISESDIASKTALDNEVTARTAADKAITDRLDVLEDVKVTGKDAIVVSSSDAKTNKEVSLKLGAQPAEGVAGIVLSQDTNGLVAKLYWGTF